MALWKDRAAYGLAFYARYQRARERRWANQLSLRGRLALDRAEPRRFLPLRPIWYLKRNKS